LKNNKGFKPVVDEYAKALQNENTWLPGQLPIKVTSAQLLAVGNWVDWLCRFQKDEASLRFLFVVEKASKDKNFTTSGVNGAAVELALSEISVAVLKDNNTLLGQIKTKQTGTISVLGNVEQGFAKEELDKERRVMQTGGVVKDEDLLMAAMVKFQYMKYGIETFYGAMICMNENKRSAPVDKGWPVDVDNVQVMIYPKVHLAWPIWCNGYYSMERVYVAFIKTGGFLKIKNYVSHYYEKGDIVCTLWRKQWLYKQAEKDKNGFGANGKPSQDGINAVLKSSYEARRKRNNEITPGTRAAYNFKLIVDQVRLAGYDVDELYSEIAKKAYMPRNQDSLEKSFNRVLNSMGEALNSEKSKEVIQDRVGKMLDAGIENYISKVNLTGGANSSQQQQRREIRKVIGTSAAVDNFSY